MSQDSFDSFGNSLEPQNSDYRPPPEYQEKKGWGCGGCLLGCLGVLLVCLLLAAGLAFYAYKKAPDMARAVVQEVLKESKLAEEDKAKIMQQVDRVVDKFKAGKISLKQLGELGQQFANSPLMASLMVHAVHLHYVAPSGLTDEEKEAAKLTLERVVRGIVDQNIDQPTIEKLLDGITIQVGDERKPKEKLTDEELRAFLKEGKAAADAAMVEEIPEPVDIGEELKQMVDKIVGEN